MVERHAQVLRIDYQNSVTTISRLVYCLIVKFFILCQLFKSYMMPARHPSLLMVRFQKILSKKFVVFQVRGFKKCLCFCLIVLIGCGYLRLVKIISILSTFFVLTLSYNAVPDSLKPSNVGLDQEAQLARQWKVSMNVTNGKKGRSGSHQYPPPITYLHLHECNKFSVSNLNLCRTSFIYWIFSLD